MVSELLHHSSSSSSSALRDSTPATSFCSSFTNRIFSDVAGDVTVIIDGESFLLHKFPMVSRCGKIRKIVADAYNSNLSSLNLGNLPGGPETFELAAKFCYGINFEMSTPTVAPLRCAAEYLEMTEDHCEQNLIQRTETYLDEVVYPSLAKSVEVLRVCEALLPMAEELGIVEGCVDAIARNACREQLVSGLSQFNCNSSPLEVQGRRLDWWAEDLSVLAIEFYSRVITTMSRAGVRTDTIVSSLMHYAQICLKGITKPQIRNPAKTRIHIEASGQRNIVETLVSILPAEKRSSVPLNFLFGLLRIAIMVDAALVYRLELEKRISLQLEMAQLDDLLIPSLQTGQSLFDIDTIHRILVHFLQRIEEEENDGCRFDSESLYSPSHDSLLKVGWLIDAYLAEVAADPYLSLEKFTAIINALPEYARLINDGLYRAIDIFLKAHPMLKEHESKKLCKTIDCQKLSQEASNHAALNDRLPVQMIARVLYFEQLRMKNALSGSFTDGYLSQKISSGVTSAAVSPRDTYASLRRENRELKLEISRMRVRLSELEKEQVSMKKGMMDRSSQGKTFLTSISKGIGKIGFFSGPAGEKHNSGKKSRA